MRGFNITSDAAGDAAGGDLDIHSLAEDSDTIVRAGIAITLRTRRGEWYQNPSLGLDPSVATYAATDRDIQAILEADCISMFAGMSGFTVTSVEASRVNIHSRAWRIIIVGKATRLLVTDFTTEIQG